MSLTEQLIEVIRQRAERIDAISAGRVEFVLHGWRIVRVEYHESDLVDKPEDMYKRKK